MPQAEINAKWAVINTLVIHKSERTRRSEGLSQSSICFSAPGFLEVLARPSTSKSKQGSATSFGQKCQGGPLSYSWTSSYFMVINM